MSPPLPPHAAKPIHTIIMHTLPECCRNIMANSDRSDRMQVRSNGGEQLHALTPGGLGPKSYLGKTGEVNENGTVAHRISPLEWKDGLPLVRMIGSAIHKPSQAHVSTNDSRYKVKLLSLLKVEWSRRAGSWTVHTFSTVVLRDVLIRLEASKRSQVQVVHSPMRNLY